MKKSSFTEEQMVGMLREADRTSVTVAAKGARRQRFGGTGAKDVKRPRQLELENARLKKIIAERDLEIEHKLY